MRSRLLSCLAQALAKNGVKFLCGLVPGGDVLFDIASDAWQNYCQGRQENALRAELQELAQAGADEVRQEAQAAVKVAAAHLPADAQQKIAAYLSQVPAVIRRSLRRPSDPTGTTVPATLSLRSPEDLLPFLPPNPPRFQPGMRPLPGVDWVLEEPLGVGGFGEVWKARHAHLTSKPPVALKFCLDPSAAQVLRNEAGVLDRLMQHGRQQGIVPLLDAYLNADPPCLVYEYVEGGDLCGLIRELHARVRPTPAAANRLILRLAEIIAAAHRADPAIVHDDLKPSNILIRRASEGFKLYVTDYGIGGLAVARAARQSQRPATSREHLLTEAVRGAYTPLYASPQQMARRRGEPADPRDDVHALGVIWYQLVTGDLTMLRVPADWTDELRGRGLHEELIGLLGTCLAPKAEKRPASAGILAAELRALTKLAPPPPPPEPLLEPGEPEDRKPEREPPEGSLEVDWRSFSKLYGDGAAKDFLKKLAPSRLRAWTAAAKQGSPEGQLLLAECFYEGIEVEKDERAAFQWFYKAAKHGNVVAQTELGVVYLMGKGVDKDEVEAVKWLRQAAEEGQASAQGVLGAMYAQGRGVDKEDATAVKWLRQSAEQGYRPAQFMLGAMYAAGGWAPKDQSEAFKWLRQAAEQGSAGAQLCLGAVYIKGRGVPKDQSEAIKWYRKAAEQGNDIGQYCLGLFYERGIGVAKDAAEAVKWYRKAAEQGHEDAKKNLRRLGPSFLQRLFG